jgi:hypothetical protein
METQKQTSTAFSHSDLVTRGEMNRLRDEVNRLRGEIIDMKMDETFKEVRTGFKEVRTALGNLHTAIHRSQMTMIRWFIGFPLAIGVLIVAAIKYLT